MNNQIQMTDSQIENIANTLLRLYCNQLGIEVKLKKKEGEKSDKGSN